VRIAASSDWRNELPFETPVLVAEVVPGDPTRCAICGPESPMRPRTELWAVKHRHPKNHDGHVRFYCLEHRPAVAVRREVPVAARKAPARAPRRTTPARPEAVPRICQNCFVEVPSSGVCGICGTPAE
jgi:hypothetical protein